MQVEFDRVYLRSVSANGGYLGNVKLEFPNELTCVIGARGTCKSTLIESIRFTIDADRERVNSLASQLPRGPKDLPHHGMIAATLGVATFECVLEAVQNNEKTDFVVEREIGSDPRLFRDGIRELTDSSLLGCVEIYSQSDLQNLAEDETQRLRLIDKANTRRISSFQQRRSKLLADLARVGLEIRQTRSATSMLNVKLRDAPAIKAQLQEIRANRPRVSDELEVARRSYHEWSGFARVFSDASNSVTTLTGTRNEVSAVLDSVSRASQDVAALRQSAEKDLVRSLARVSSHLTAAVEALDDALRVDLNAAHQILLIETAEVEATYRSLQKQEQVLNEALRQEDALVKQYEYMEQLSAELTKVQEREASLLERRRQLRSEVQKISEEIFEIRMTQVEVINADSHGVVLLTGC